MGFLSLLSTDNNSYSFAPPLLSKQVFFELVCAGGGEKVVNHQKVDKNSRVPQRERNETERVWLYCKHCMIMNDIMAGMRDGEWDCVFVTMIARCRRQSVPTCSNNDNKYGMEKNNFPP